MAVPGLERDGNSFIPDAIQAGAAAIVTETPTAVEGDLANHSSSVRTISARRSLRRLLGTPFTQAHAHRGYRD